MTTQKPSIMAAMNYLQ